MEVWLAPRLWYILYVGVTLAKSQLSNARMYTHGVSLMQVAVPHWSCMEAAAGTQDC